MPRKQISVTKESESGRNTKFRDNYKKTSMTRVQFVKNIEAGNYPDYHIRNIGGVKTPVSNPDGKTGNNLD